MSTAPRSSLMDARGGSPRAVSVAVGMRFVRASTDTPMYSACSLVSGGQPHSQGFEVKPGHLFVEVFGKHVDPVLVVAGVVERSIWAMV